VDITAIDYNGWSEARENWHFGTRCQVEVMFTREPDGVKRLYFLKFWSTLNCATLQFGNKS
jgi:hypothetical protein